MTPQELLLWLTNNEQRRKTDPDGYESDLSEIIEGIDGSGYNSTDVNNVLSLARTFLGEDSPLYTELEVRVDTTVDESDRRAVLDANEDGDVSEEEVQQGRGSADPTVREAAEAEASSTFTLDKKYLDAFGVGQGGRTEQDAIDAILDRVEEEHGIRFDTVAEAEQKGYLTDPLLDAAVEQFVVSTEQGEPEFYSTSSIDLTGGDMFTIRTVELDQATQVLGVNEAEFGKYVDLADQAGLRRQDGTGVAWQPLAALIRATGQNVVGQSQEKQDELLARIQQLNTQIRGIRNSPASPEQIAARVRSLEAERDAVNKEYRASQPKLDGGRTPAGSDPWAGINDTPGALAIKYRQGLALYGGNESLAFFHGIDEGLAARISASGGDFAALADGDTRLAGQYISQAFPGAASTDQLIGALVNLGYGEAAGSDTIAGLMSLLEARSQGSGGGAAARTRIMPDRVQVEQAAKDFYQQLYMAEPDEATLRSFTDQVMSQVAGAPLDEDVNVNARIRDIAEGLPEYQELYGKKGNLTEAEYQGMHRSGQASILGDEIAGNQATKLGMRQGQYQTSVGAATGTSEAWDNSTFLGRLARASQVVNANT